MATSIISNDEVSIFLMDKPKWNTLVAGTRWDSQQIDQAIVNSIDYINSASPPIRPQFTVETWPYRYILLIGVAGYLLKSAAIGDASNMLTYTAEGFSTSDRDKAEIFATMGSGFWQDFEAKVEQVKINMNVARAYGRKSSPYSSLPTV
jgi:hypothetical protein